MFGALESASKLLPSEEPWTMALPATLVMLVLMPEKGSAALHFW